MTSAVQPIMPKTGFKFVLTVIDGPDVGATYQLLPPRATIGRGPDNTIVCDMDNVSRSHCKIYAGAGGSYIEDMGSTNGRVSSPATATGPQPRASGGDSAGGGALASTTVAG